MSFSKTLLGIALCIQISPLLSSAAGDDESLITSKNPSELSESELSESDRIKWRAALAEYFNDTIDFQEDLLWSDLNSAIHAQEYPAEKDTPVFYRVLATTLHSAIFLIGVTGNTLLIIVAHKSEILKNPTYTYLVSMAYADLLICVTAIPEAIINQNFGNQWFLGEYGCALFIFLNFFGINAGVTSMFLLTMERYIAICHPLLSRKICSLNRTRKIVCCAWIFAFIYCCPWLGLTAIKKNPQFPDREFCDFRLSGEYYMIIFSADLLLFYIIPLLSTVIVYLKIWLILKRSPNLFQTKRQVIPSSSSRLSNLRYEDSCKHKRLSPGSNRNSDGSYERLMRSRIQVLRMLFVIVMLFAISWLPFRGLLLYNKFATVPWLDIWYVLFAKTLIYINSAINPVLYNAMSSRFRRAVRETICRRPGVKN